MTRSILSILGSRICSCFIAISVYLVIIDSLLMLLLGLEVGIRLSVMMRPRTLMSVGLQMLLILPGMLIRMLGGLCWLFLLGCKAGNLLNLGLGLCL